MSTDASPKPPSAKAGCITLVILVFIGGFIADLAGCNGSNDTDAQKILKESMGANNPIAKRILSLDRNNAYQAGVQDGANEVSNAALKFNWSQYDYRGKLEEYREGKRIAFDMLATQNQFDSVAFERYREGWDRGASSLSMQ